MSLFSYLISAIVCDDCYIIVCSSIYGFCLLFDIFKRFLAPIALTMIYQDAKLELLVLVALGSTAVTCGIRFNSGHLWH
jgi:hypothetical protein